MSVPRPVVHVAMLAAIAAGIWLGTQAFAFFAGG
jgi:hypothetical protein